MQAGGYLTNTNQSVSFLRNPARDAVIAIDGAYSNPAGLGFLPTGWHMGFDLQSAYQTRTATSFFGPASQPPFALGTVNGVANPADGIKKFEGHAKAPVIPSVDLARVGEKWFASFHFGITGGGGKCKFDEGLGSFESQVALLPVLMSAVAPGAVTGYTMDTKMQGRQYYFGGQFGVGYKILPNLSVSVGGRVVYADCNYYGYVRNIGVKVNNPAVSGGQPVEMSAADFLTAQGMPHFASLVEDRDLNCDQTGWGFTPIVSVDYKWKRLNVAARYEFRTKLRLKNRSGVNTSGLEEYDDGKKIASDIPAILTLGAQYEVIDGLRLSGGFHYYFDKKAKQYNDRQKHLANGGWEVLAGAEYDVSRRWTVSAGWQTTHYGLGKDSKFLSDMSFVTNSNSVGFGARFQLRKKVHLNFAYFKTLYKHYKKHMADYDDLKSKYGAMLPEMGAKLQAAAQECQAVLNNAQATAEQKALASQQLGIISNESTALSGIVSGLSGYNTAGYDNFHRTNDVFGVGLEIDF